MIRIGRRVYSGAKYVDPVFKDFIPIVSLTKSSPYGSLGPYLLKNRDGFILENVWQFSKVYARVQKSTQKYSRWDDTVIWDYPAEVHLDVNDEPNLAYWRWRSKGMSNPYPVRYPVGYGYRSKCLYSLVKTDRVDYEKLDYIQSREKLYLPMYLEAVKKEKQFHELVTLLREGKNLLIIEVDGPHQESLPYYKEKYGVDDSFIENNTMLYTDKNLEIMLKDPKHPFGHGYCLAKALSDAN